MDNKLKLNTQIPMFPKPAFKATSKTNILSFQSGTSSALKETKPLVKRTYNLRRSKSAADFRSVTRLNTGLTKQISLQTNPIKRPALVETTVANKTVKLSKPEPVKVKTVKPAPYDYKARFNLLKEQHDKLKIVHRELKNAHQLISDQNNELITTNENLKSELNSITTLLNIKTKELLEKKDLFDATNEQNKTLLTTKEQLDKKLKATKQNLEFSTSELIGIKNKFDTTASTLEERKIELNETKENLQNKHLMLQNLEIETQKLHNIIQQLSV